MIILTRKELMKLPAGTVWSYYEPCVFRGLYIKDSVYKPDYPDFSVSDLIGAVANDSSVDFVAKCDEMESGASLPVDFEYSGREGMFDDRQLFSVYEPSDVDKLITRLQEANRLSKQI